jgi:hypothetical protein
LAFASNCRPDQNSHAVFTTHAKAATTDLQQARAAGLEHLQQTAVAQAHLSHAANSTRFTLHVFDNRTIAGLEQFKGQDVFAHGEDSKKSSIRRDSY